MVDVGDLLGDRLEGGERPSSNCRRVAHMVPGQRQRRGQGAVGQAARARHGQLVQVRQAKSAPPSTCSTGTRSSRSVYSGPLERRKGCGSRSAPSAAGSTMTTPVRWSLVAAGREAHRGPGRGPGLRAVKRRRDLGAGHPAVRGDRGGRGRGHRVRRLAQARGEYHLARCGGGRASRARRSPASPQRTTGSTPVISVASGRHRRRLAADLGEQDGGIEHAESVHRQARWAGISASRPARASSFHGSAFPHRAGGSTRRAGSPAGSPSG